MKRLLILTLAVAMVATFGASVALAAPGDLSPTPAFSDIAGHPAEADLTALGALQVFTGAYGLGGAVAPNDPITRAQFCKVVIVAKNLTAVAQGLMGLKPMFTDANDIPTWAWGYVNAAVQAGIIGGYPDGTFKANNPVKYSEAIKMLVCMITGHKSQVDPALPWPNNYVFYGVSRGFTDDVAIIDPGASCTRGDMARMLFATMKVDPLNPDGSPDTDGAILEDTGTSRRLYSGTFLGRTGGQLFIDSIPGPLALGDPVYLLGASSYGECTGVEVVCVANTAGNVVFIHRAAGNTISGIFKQLGSDPAGSYMELASTQKVYYTPSIPVLLNQDTGTPNTQTCLKNGDTVLINLDGGGSGVAVTATRYDLICTILLVPHIPAPPPFTITLNPHPEDYLAGVTLSAGATPTKITFPGLSPFFYSNGGAIASLAGVTLDVGSTCTVKINGAPASRDLLAKDDVIKAATYGAAGYFNPASIVEISATRNLADGIVTTNRSVFDASGTRYYTTMNIGGTISEFERNNDHYLPAEPTVGLRYKFGREENGMLFFNSGVTDEHPIVYVKSASTSTGPHYYITCDVKGVEQTWECTADRSAWTQTFRCLTIDGGTGMVTAGVDYTPDWVTNYNVVASTTSSVTLQNLGGTWFAQDPPLVVYRKSGTTYTYIGCAGLTVGWQVHCYLDAGTPRVVVYEAP